ncbi:MAG: peptide ABC transporter substrate-binding protein [Clostridia bacterium]|nr:peptide ABC transporter substrate-binding protein [Clostridia bacterium]
MKRWFSLILILLLAACRGEYASEPAQTDLSGEFVVKESSSIIRIPVYSFDTFNPIATNSTSVADAMRLIYEPLFEIDKNFNTNPVLAKGYNLSSDGLRIEIYLRDDVNWHDGTKFTAYDVDYTVKSILQGNSVYKSNLQDVAEYRVQGNYTYVFTLKHPTPNFEALLDFPIVQNKTGMSVDADYIPIGTGPYMFTSENAAKRIVLKANANWHGGNVNIKNISIFLLKDKETAVSAFEANEVDCITTSALSLKKYMPRGKTTQFDYISNDMTYLGINFFNSVLWGSSTRKAISCLIDKNTIVSGILYDRGEAVDIPVNPSAWYYDSQSRVYTFDTARAAELLAADGWALSSGVYTRNFNGTVQPLKLEILTNSDNKEKVDIANNIAKTFSENGILATVKAVSFSEYQSLIKEKRFDLFVGEIVMPDNMDPSFLLGSGGNYFTYSNPEMDALIMRMGTVQGKDALKQMYVQFGELFNKEIPFIPIFFRKESLISNASVSGEVEPSFRNVYKNIAKWYVYNK